MNKFGFLSSILTFVLFLCMFIPLGLEIGVEGTISVWLGKIFDITTNPWIGAHVHIPIELINYGNQQVFLWGIVQGGNIYLWYEIHILGFILLFCLSLVSAVLALVGSVKESLGGKKLIAFNSYAILTIFLFVIIGIPIYSKEILGSSMNFLDIFFLLNFGFYLLLIDLICALIAYPIHPVGEK